ncbi:four-helix bundle copper-binding protein [Gorillibacterium sp. sgz500922]|uniref:four-helix bundle copper-binding protein n=1 Tax=Gorillibacterium sp. sgz500922 TaxID=3446694 RepID=UPI003F67BCA3
MSHEAYRACIEECLRCMVACNHCYSACLKEKDLEMMRDCIRLDRECADLCEFAARMMAAGSSYTRELCRLCAEACLACGNECKKHDHEHCQACAKACFSCAEACQAMLGLQSA